MNTKPDKVIELSRRQMHACNIIFSAFILLAGLLLLLIGLQVIKISILDALAPILLGAVGLALTVTAIIQRNTVSMWLGGALLACMTASIIAAAGGVAYSSVYPVYIAAPAIASLFTLPISDSKKFHLGFIVFFGVLSGLFSLRSSGLCGWAISAPLIVIFVGIVVLGYSIYSFKTNKGE